MRVVNCDCAERAKSDHHGIETRETGTKTPVSKFVAIEGVYGYWDTRYLDNWFCSECGTKYSEIEDI
jgi:hypothetical protein